MLGAPWFSLVRTNNWISAFHLFLKVTPICLFTYLCVGGAWGGALEHVLATACVWRSEGRCGSWFFFSLPSCRFTEGTRVCSLGGNYLYLLYPHLFTYLLIYLFILFVYLEAGSCFAAHIHSVVKNDFRSCPYLPSVGILSMDYHIQFIWYWVQNLASLG